MSKIIKFIRIVLVIIFFFLGISAGLFSLVIPGIAVSGLGCGPDCERTINLFRCISFFFLILSIITGVYPIIVKYTFNKSSRTGSRK